MTGCGWLVFSKGKWGWLEVCRGMFCVKEGDLIFFTVELGWFHVVGGITF